MGNIAKYMSICRKENNASKSSRKLAKTPPKIRSACISRSRTPSASAKQTVAFQDIVSWRAKWLSGAIKTIVLQVSIKSASTLVVQDRFWEQDWIHSKPKFCSFDFAKIFKAPSI